jgi:hypothetical protein
MGDSHEIGSSSRGYACYSDLDPCGTTVATYTILLFCTGLHVCPCQIAAKSVDRNASHYTILQHPLCQSLSNHMIPTNGGMQPVHRILDCQPARCRKVMDLGSWTVAKGFDERLEFGLEVGRRVSDIVEDDEG